MLDHEQNDADRNETAADVERAGTDAANTSRGRRDASQDARSAAGGSAELPTVSVILPVRCEGAAFAKTLERLVRQDYPADRMEILVVDGMSTDETRDVVRASAARDPRIHLLDNPGLIVPTAMNIGIAAASGEIVVRIDGHTVVPEDYVRRSVEALRRSGAQCAGGLMTAVGDSFFGRLVASATSGPFGVGNSQFHYADQPMFTESAYMGSWPRDVLVRLGGFDEEMVRNQDDELNYRLRKLGGKVYLDPAIRSEYRPRGSLRKLFKQYFQYGYWKVRVFQKHPSMLRARHFIPAIFVLWGTAAAVAVAVLGPWASGLVPGAGTLWPWAAGLLAGGVALYLAAAWLAAWKSPGAPPGRWAMPLVFFTIHAAYGTGFLAGLVRFLPRWFLSDPPPALARMKDLVQYSGLAIALLICLMSRRWCLPVLAACLPIYRWFPAVPIPGVNVQNILLLPVLWRAVQAGPPKDRERRRDPLATPMLLLSILFFISWLRVQLEYDLPRAFLDANGLYNNALTLKEFLTCFLLYFCGRRLARDPDSIRLTFFGSLAGFVWEALTSAREFFFSGALRATAHLDQPNKLGHFLAAYLFLPFGFLLEGGRRYFLRAAVVVFVACLGLMAAVSRGAIVASGLAMAIVAASRRSLLVIPIVFVVFTYDLWLPERVVERFDSSMTEEQGQWTFDTEHEGRVLIWKPVVRMALSNPFGVGLSQIRYNLPRYGYMGSKLRDAHNIYLQLAAEDGVLALIVHVWLMLAISLISFRLARRDPGSLEACLAMGMFGTTVSFMISGFFGNFFYSNNLSGVFWILTGILVNLSQGVRLTVSTPDAAAAPRSNSSRRGPKLIHGDVAG